MRERASVTNVKVVVEAWIEREPKTPEEPSKNHTLPTLVLKQHNLLFVDKHFLSNTKIKQSKSFQF